MTSVLVGTAAQALTPLKGTLSHSGDLLVPMAIGKPTALCSQAQKETAKGKQKCDNNNPRKSSKTALLHVQCGRCSSSQGFESAERRTNCEKPTASGQINSTTSSLPQGAANFDLRAGGQAQMFKMRLHCRLLECSAGALSTNR